MNDRQVMNPEDQANERIRALMLERYGPINLLERERIKSPWQLRNGATNEG